MVSARDGSSRPEQALDIRLVVDTIPTSAWSADSDGSADFFNKRWLEYTGLSAEQALSWGWKVAIHPDDLPRMLETFQEAVDSGKPFETEGRFRRHDGEFRWFLFRGNPLLDGSGRVVRWYGTNTDIEDRKRAEEALRSSEQTLRLVVDGIPGFVFTATADGEIEFVNKQILDYTGRTLEELKRWQTTDLVHPDDLPQVIAELKRSIETGRSQGVEHRVRGADGKYRWFVVRRLSQQDPQGCVIRWYILLSDIDDRKRAEDALRESERSLRLIFETIPGFVWTMSATGEVELVSQQMVDYFGKTVEELRDWSSFVHPEDRARVVAYWRRTIETGEAYEVEHRLRRADGVYRWFQGRGRPWRDAKGNVVRWHNLLTDVDDRRRAEEALRENEQNLRLMIDSIPGFVATLSAAGEIEHVNRQTLEYFGKTKDELRDWAANGAVHPADAPGLMAAHKQAIETGQPFESEHRSRRVDGEYRWFQARFSPQRDSEGRVLRWYSLVTDIDERKRAEAELEKAIAEITRLKDRLHDENVALKEQIDQAFMFEEIVGSSSALKTVVASILKVAPTDSTVLITGETGTGKELIARAIHKASRRSAYPFIAVNCAAIPASLIASELFGHEKGAFTGALQRHQGRFELAHSGTLFLDEIGELPAETQIALLRVLQERRFERVGGNRAIPVDVRVIAAANRDLTAAIAAGIFRADLFYRLNVFPIAMPPLRDRKEDIPMLVEYFVKRYAEKAGKQISKIDKNTLRLCQSYDWPGNIRELQNIVERAVILCTGETFWIDAAWLSTQARRRVKSSDSLKKTLQSYEKELIEAALAESGGKVAGADGAAAKLGIPRSTLDLKIKQLNISKNSIH